MLKQFFIAGSLLVASFSALAAEQIPTVYHFDFKTSNDSSSFSLTTEIGKAQPMQFGIESAESKEAAKETNCKSMKLVDEISETNFLVNQTHPDQNTVMVYPVSIDKDTIKLVLIYDSQESKSSGTPLVISDKCSIGNILSTTVNMQWAGDVKVGEKTKIPLTNGDSLFVTATEYKKEN